MRRLILLNAYCALWLMFGGASPASADNGPHRQDRDGVAYPCATCHRGEPQPVLCYSCHGSTGTGAQTDVQGGVGYVDDVDGTRATRVAALRGGGFQYALIDSANPTGQSDQLAVPPESSSLIGMVPVMAVGSATTSSHTVDGTTGTAWGSDTANAGVVIPLRCTSCHDAHGNGNYRILKSLPNTSGVTVPVMIADGATKDYTTANYWKVDDANALGYIANVSAWCSTCHSRYLATEDTVGLLLPNQRSQFDTGDAVYRYRHTSDGKTQGGKSCIQCHVSHGSNASMGTNSGHVGNPDGTLAADDSKLLRIDNRGTCEMCHKR